MASNLSASEREDLRIAMLGFLATCNACAFTAGQLAPILRRHRSVAFPITDADVESALIFLDGQKWTMLLQSDCGASMSHQITSAGVLEAERRGLC